MEGGKRSLSLLVALLSDMLLQTGSSESNMQRVIPSTPLSAEGAWQYVPAFESDVPHHLSPSHSSLRMWETLNYRAIDQRRSWVENMLRLLHSFYTYSGYRDAYDMRRGQDAKIAWGSGENIRSTGADLELGKLSAEREESRGERGQNRGLVLGQIIQKLEVFVPSF